jgi:hypothetical protein
MLLMKLNTRSAALAALVAGAAFAAGCDPPPEQGTAFIEGVLALEAPECSADAGDNTFVAGALLDVGFDPNGVDANSLVLPLKVRTNLPSTFSTTTLTQDQTRSPNYPSYGNVDTNVITFTTSEIFYSTDADRGDELQLQNPGTPLNDNTARRIGVSGVAFNEQTQLLSESVVFTTGIAKEDAAALAAEPFVSAGLVNADSRVRVIVNMRLEGTTTGNALVRTPLFPFGVDLCRGCLIPDCDDDEIAVPINDDGVCVRGQNDPFECVPAP